MAKLPTSQALPLAIQHHQAGRLPQAEALYREVLARDPQCVDALHYLGVIAHQVGKHGLAAELIGRAAALAPEQAAIHSNLGEAYRHLGRLDEAIASFRQALALQPNYPDALSNLGNALTTQCQFDEAIACYRQVLTHQPHSASAHYNLGIPLTQLDRFDEAVACFQQAIVLKPDFAEAHSNLGKIFSRRRRFGDASVSFRQALALKPDFAEAHNNLGNLHRAQGQLDEAIACFRQALTLKPHLAKTHSNLGGVFSQRGRLDEAIASFNQAIALDPNLAEAHYNLGSALQQRRQLVDAIACYQRALALNPDYAEAYNNLGCAFELRGQLDDALACCQRALTLKPGYVEAHTNLGNIFKAQGRLDNALACYRRACELNPGYLPAHSNLIYALHFHVGSDATAIRDEHRCWCERHAAPLATLKHPHANDRTPERRLRLGYVSPDFRNQAECFFVLPLLEAHDHTRFEIYAYASVSNPDGITERMRHSFDVWHDVLPLTDAQLADQIRTDGIDLLVDLTMHMAHNRMPVFACKPAPVQVTWLGYPATAGLDTIDYRLTDHHLEPAGEDYPFSAETPVRLPDSWCCYQPVTDMPPCADPPVLRKGHITFGSLNNFCKINEAVLHRWARVLLAVPNSALLLLCPEGTTRQRTLALLSTQGVDSNRIEFVARQSRQDYLRTYHRIDICLDPFPYNGITTTLDALWMGVPVLTLPGPLPPARVGASLLTTLGLPELIASSETDYIVRATALARDLPRLAGLRAGLRERMQRSPLMDAPRFARAVETAYCTMWQRWCTLSASPSAQGR